MNATAILARLFHRRMARILLIAAVAIPTGEARAQIVGQRLEAPPAKGPKTLSIRESHFSSVTPKAESTYRKVARSRTFLLEKTEGQTRYEWEIGGQVRPIDEGLPNPEPVIEKQVKFLSHEGKQFVKIEASIKPDPAQAAEEKVRFSGTYETSTVEGSWDDYESGGKVRVKIVAADHERYLEEILRAFYGPKTLAPHANEFRTKLIGILERKVADPGSTPPAELEAVHRIVALAKTEPGTIAVAVAATFESDPEVFLLEGETMRSTTTDQVLTLHFKAGIRDPGPSGVKSPAP